MHVYKYQLQDTLQQTVNLSVGAKILSVHEQYGSLCLWALVDADLPTSPRVIEIYGTGHVVPAGKREFIGTVVTMGGRLVWHVFELFET